MILLMQQKEMATLLLHMTIMRKNVRQGFKKNYGTKEGKEVLASYDEVKTTLSEILKLEEEAGEVLEGPQVLHFNIKEIEMLDSFLTFYNKEVNESLGDKNIHQKDREQIDTLKEIKEQLDEVRAAYA